MLRLVYIALLVAACGVSVPRGQYGPYVSGQEKHLRLASGESLVVYRVKVWTFSSGDDPAMQFEYEALDSLSDTVALRRRARELWPAFGPYVESLGLNNGIVTATRLHRHGIPGFWTVTSKHFGLLVYRDSVGTWRFKDGGDLPPAAPLRGPQIIEPTGQPMPFPTKLPTVSQ